LQGILNLVDTASRRLPRLRLQAFILLVVTLFSWGLALAVGLGLALGHYPLLGAVVGILAVVGTVSAGLLLSHHSFLSRLELEYSLIEKLERIDPIPRFPEGDTLEERYLKHLSSEGHHLTVLPAKAPFEQIWTRPSGRFWRSLGFGSSGMAVTLTTFQGQPLPDQIIEIERQTHRLQDGLMMPLVSVVLWKGELDELLSRPLNRLSSARKHRGHLLPCEVQLAVELPDGTYELVPRLPQALAR